MSALNYNHLYYFWMIAKEGGVTAACKKLNLTQPTLSAQLKQFEFSMGQNLFDRKAKKLILNDAGKLIFDYADTIFKKGEEMLSALQDTTVKDVVSVNIGVLSTLPKKNVHNILKVPIGHGKINVNIQTGPFEYLLEELKALQLDVVLSDRPAPTETNDFQSHLAEKAPIIFVASPDHKGVRRKFPQSLADQNIYLPSHQTEVRQQIDLYFKRHEISPRIKGQIQDMELLRVIAVGGHGIVAVPRSAVSDLLKAKELYIIGDNLDIWSHHYLISTDRQAPHPVVMDLLKKFRQ